MSNEVPDVLQLDVSVYHTNSPYAKFHPQRAARYCYLILYLYIPEQLGIKLHLKPSSRVWSVYFSTLKKR